MCFKILHKKSIMERQYMNDFHKKSSEASLKEVEQMLKHPLSFEDALLQTKTKMSETNTRRRNYKSIPKD
jgi:hypothetical protein